MGSWEQCNFKPAQYRFATNAIAEVNLIVALHTEQVEVSPPIGVDVDRRSIPGPSFIDHSRGCRNVLKLSITQIAIELAGLTAFRLQVPGKGVGEADIVDISERRGHADTVTDEEACTFSNVLEFSTSQVAPEFVAANLIDKVDVEFVVVIHIRHNDAGAEIIVDSFESLARLIDDLVHEPDTAGWLPARRRKKNHERRESSPQIPFARVRVSPSIPGSGVPGGH